ncbi:MAG TPA: aldehyde dehydrogenase family protein, partial [Chthonomonadales bacterium]|nr:aldehyde dehydrogenase family protein [Chthonomonadales bacterium]
MIEESKQIDIKNPATGEVIAQVPDAGQAGVDQAVSRARDAYRSGTWRGLPPSERARRLWKLGDIIRRETDDLCRLESLNNGKTVREAHSGDLPGAWDIFHYFAGCIRNMSGDTLPVDGSCLSYTLREPLGVVGAIVAWNYPLLLACWKLAPALACGNCVVLKPSELTPLTALKLQSFVREAGLGDGVVNIVTGYGHTTGEALARHHEVDKIAFTG